MFLILFKTPEVMNIHLWGSGVELFESDLVVEGLLVLSPEEVERVLGGGQKHGHPVHLAHTGRLLASSTSFQLHRLHKKTGRWSTLRDNKI